jgi:5-carboxymethyl-2-hydroxymuconate isomerase
MPHCIFEYSANVADKPDWPQIIRKLHDSLISTGQFVAGDIKSRVIRHDNFLMYREIPRLCRGGSSSLTFTGVHPGNSER